MSEQVSELRRINWSECFPFTRIFRTFRLAVSAKLALALAGILLTCLWGGILDSLWSPKCRPLKNEVGAFSQVASVAQWRDENRTTTIKSLKNACSEVGVTLPIKLADEFAKQPSKVIDDALKEIAAKHRKVVGELTDQLDKDKNLAKEQKRERIAEKAKPLVTAYAQVRSMGPRGVFCGFMSYECQVGKQFMHAARTLNFTGGLEAALSPRGAGQGDSSGLVPTSYGVLPCVILVLRGVQWMWAEHWLYFILFWLPVLAIWALFGGAICRMAALDLARDEKLSPKAAVCFAWRKLLGFASAPLVPIVIVVSIGLVHALGGLCGSFPWLGEIVGGLIAGLALVGGFLMAMITVGAVAGGSLMWPTIAVEGSDGFDAMSRSYSYVYGRPWHAAFYAAVTAVYGAVCYLFVRFFVFVALRAARFFVGMGLIGHRPGTGGAGAHKVDVIWAAPTFADLVPSWVPLGSEGWVEPAMAWLFHAWMLLVAALLAAFVVSFFLSGSTVIYFLLRRHVDATDFDDVFLEEGEDGCEPPMSGFAPAGAFESAAAPASAPVPSAPPADAANSSASADPKPAAQEPEPPASPQP